MVVIQQKGYFTSQNLKNQALFVVLCLNFLATYYNKLPCKTICCSNYLKNKSNFLVTLTLSLSNKILTNSLSSLYLFHFALYSLKFSLLLVPLSLTLPLSHRGSWWFVVRFSMGLLCFDRIFDGLCFSGALAVRFD